MAEFEKSLVTSTLRSNPATEDGKDGSAPTKIVLREGFCIGWRVSGKRPLMKISKYLTFGLLIISLTPVFGQPNGVATPPLAPRPSSNFDQRLQAIIRQAGSSPQNEAPALTKFNLDFSGGTPAQLVKAIEKAMGKPLNAIISTGDADVQLPPLKMNDVNVAQLFQALEQASIKQMVIVTGNYGGGQSSYSTFTGNYGFKTVGPISDSSIWYFHMDKPSLPPVVSAEKVCQFYSLELYLNRGFTVDDITTAIQTGWKMSGITALPELNYHKETKMLIAFGEPRELDIIGRVLGTLPSSAITHDEINDLKNRVGQLQDQVTQLRKKASASVAAQTASPEEKSGK
jgi:hypothetical protein